MRVWPALLVTIISVGFAVTVIGRYRRHPSYSQLLWSISLCFSGLASLGYCVAIWLEPTGLIGFLFYYVCGALWMPALMGLGSLGLIATRRWLWIATVSVVLFGLAGTVMLIVAPVSLTALSHLNGGAGVGVLQTGWWLVFLISLNSFGAIAVFGVAVWSAVKTIRKQSPVRFLYGNLWLAAGILLISAAGSSARLGWPSLFWITMLIGWVVTLVGYLFLSPSALPRRKNGSGA